MTEFLLPAVLLGLAPALYRIAMSLERIELQRVESAPEGTAAPFADYPVEELLMPDGSPVSGMVADLELEKRAIMEWQIEHGLEATGEMPPLPEDANSPLSTVEIYPRVAQIR